MKIELLIIAITVFFVFNTYTDGNCVKVIKSWKKQYQMAGIAFAGLSAFLFLRKYPSHTHSLLQHANGMIKYMPIDKEAGDMLSPLLNMTKNHSGGMFSYNGNSPSQEEKRILNSGRVYNSPDELSHAGGGTGNGGTGNNNVKITKRSVSETKKKYVAAQQGWNCGGCKKQLPAWFEVDHKIRLDNGGSNHVDNLVALCRDCHGKKTAFENL
jgi:hypothetical protein